jgi:aminoglycoside phosphotransferase (APT) family kinase protein
LNINLKSEVKCVQGTFETRELEHYLNAALQTAHLSMHAESPSNTIIQILNFNRIRGTSHVYSIELSFRKGNIEQRQDLILKAYVENADPVMRSWNPSRVEERCWTEFQVLKSLKRVGFPVPEAYLCERNSSYFGFPFIITSKVEQVRENVKAIDCWAATLARLHNLSLKELGIEGLRSPRNEYAFAKSFPIRYKQFLTLASKHDRKLKKHFELAVNWLKSNEAYNYCPKYCLIHGDYHPGNAFVTKNSGLIVIDWDTVKIGDPAFDVGCAYHYINHLSKSKAYAEIAKLYGFGEFLFPSALECGAADRFISEYNRNFKGDTRRRMQYYQVVGILEVAMFHSLFLSNPLTAYRRHGRKALIAFPFIRSPRAAKMIGTSFEVLWLQYFEDFLDRILN